MDGFHRTFLGHVRTTFLRGIAVIVPLGLTFWFFRALLNALDGVFSPLLTSWIGQQIPGLGFLAMLLLILAVGLLTRNLVGRLLFAWFENLLRSIPFVRSVYSGIKDLVNAFNIGGSSKTFRLVVMLEWPRRGVFCIGFVTNESRFAGADPPLDLYHVYIPNPPNPTSGFLALIPKGDAVPLALSVEEGLKLVLSGGIVTPAELHRLKIAQP
ncbi:MAG TPA: DUF502 domain-containing protein [Bacteroidota bacterium]|nr:DUF502 domain-containing protein [Bacteroidota bacterium]